MPPSIVFHDSHYHSNIMKSKPMNHAELKLALEQETAVLNELLKTAQDLFIPVAVKPDTTAPKSGNDLAVTTKLLTIVYPAKI